MKQSLPISLFIIVISVLPLCLMAQGVSSVQLKQEQVAFSPKSFYISAVSDSLPDNSTIGTITDGAKKQKVVMQGGISANIKRFIDANIKQDNSTQPVVLNIAKLDVDIKNKGNLHAVTATIGIDFYAGGLRLMTYNGKGSAETDTDPAGYVEQFIRKTIAKDLAQFDTWWAAHKNDIPVSSTVKVNVVISKTIDQPDCIVYSTRRPLQISDFTGPPQNDVSELAATYSGIKFSTTGETEKGQLVINVTLIPYFNRSESWFKDAGKNPILLAHEQAHFDITAIKACELAEAIRKATFTKDNYMTLFDQLRKQYVDESNNEQNVYDAETSHGTIPDKQQEWQQKISKQVKEIGCY